MRRFCITVFIFLVTLLSTGISVPVLADGGFFIRSQEHIDAELYETGQKAIIVYQDNIETMVLHVQYEGDVSEFAWVVPVPGYPTVGVADVALFEDLAYATAPVVSNDKSIGCVGGVFSAGGSRTLVDVWEEGNVGIYHYAVLSADNSSTLVNWLNDNGYVFPENGSSVVGEYINKGWYFVAAKIKASDQGNTSGGVIQPLQLSFEYDEIVYPLKISSLSSIESRIILYVFCYTCGAEVYIDDNWPEGDLQWYPLVNHGRLYLAEYPNVALHDTDQILHLPRKDNVFYQEYSDEINGEYDVDQWNYFIGMDKLGNFSDLLGKESYFMTKLTAVVKADQMVDITLVELNSEYVLDSDNDGWSDDEETIIGTNPYKADTDGDGTKDPWDGAPLYNRDVRIAIIVISVIILLISFYLLTYKHRFWRAIFSEIRKDWWKWIALIFFLALLVAFIMLGL